MRSDLLATPRRRTAPERPSARRAAAPHVAGRWWLGVVLVTLVAAGTAAFGEHIRIADGFGWDGEFYATFVRDPAGMLRVGIDSYRLQRIAPALVVHAGLRLVGADVSSARAVVTGFQLLDVACLALTALLWLRLARTLALGTAAYWLGVVGLFANHAVLKTAAYYPVLNDVPALCLGMLAVWAFVERRAGVLATVGVVGAFTWPVAAPLVALLLAAPRRPVGAPGASQRPWLAIAAAAAAGAGLVAAFAFAYYGLGMTVTGMGPVTPVYAPLAPWGAVAAAVCLAAASYGLLRPLSPAVVLGELRALRWPRVAAGAAVVLVPALVIRQLEHGAPILTPAGFAGFLVVLGSARPLVAPVAHVTYLGPVLLLLLPLRHEYLRVVHEWGVGATLATLAAVVVALSPESRQSLFALPLVIVPLCLAAQRAAVRARVIAVLALLAAALSHAWLVVNTAPPAVLADPGADYRAVYARYFMKHGPYMTNAEYVAHALAVAAASLVLAAVWALGTSRGDADARPGGSPSTEPDQNPRGGPTCEPSTPHCSPS